MRMMRRRSIPKRTSTAMTANSKPDKPCGGGGGGSVVGSGSLTSHRTPVKPGMHLENKIEKM